MPPTPEDRRRILLAIAKFVLILSGVLLGGVGLLFLLNPMALAQGAQVGLDASYARTEIRAVYGGIELAIGAFFLWASRAPDRYLPGLMLSILVGFGAGLGRLVGFAVDGVEQKHILWTVLEIGGSLGVINLIVQLRKSEKAVGEPS